MEDSSGNTVVNSVITFSDVYKNRIDVIELLVGQFYQTAFESDCSVKASEKERHTLEEELEILLAKNCCIRHKDFKVEMQKVLSDLSVAEDELFKERDLLMEEVRVYLSQQKELVDIVQNKLRELLDGMKSREQIECSIDTFRINANAEELLRKLRRFQEKVYLYRKEQSELNRKLKLLVDRGKELTLEDIRRLRSKRLIISRNSEKEIRREEIRKFLSDLRKSRRSKKIRWYFKEV